MPEQNHELMCFNDIFSNIEVYILNILWMLFNKLDRKHADLMNNFYLTLPYLKQQLFNQLFMFYFNLDYIPKHVFLFIEYLVNIKIPMFIVHFIKYFKIANCPKLTHKKFNICNYLLKFITCPLVLLLNIELSLLKLIFQINMLYHLKHLFMCLFFVFMNFESNSIVGIMEQRNLPWLN